MGQVLPAHMLAPRRNFDQGAVPRILDDPQRLLAEVAFFVGQSFT